jgi:succinate dehydrogenase/fumarate reductase-like Fe-S protein
MINMGYDLFQPIRLLVVPVFSGVHVVRDLLVLYLCFVDRCGNQKSYIEEKQTTQWRKEKVQKDKQRSTKHKYKTKRSRTT